MANIRKDSLQTPIDQLQGVLKTPPSGGGPNWVDRVRNALTQFERGLHDHEKSAEAPNGAMTILNSSKQDTAPILDRKVQQFRFEHLEFIDTTRGLIQRIDNIRGELPNRTPSEVAAEEIAEVVEKGTTLLNRVREHQTAEEKLLLESVTQDIGAGD